MQSVTPFLWMNDQAADAADHYVNVFDDAEIVSTMPGPGESPMGVTVRVKNLQFTLFNGGPRHELDEACSLMVMCDDQAEVDRLWERLTEGGREDMCGWLKDRFGVSWQIIPSGFAELMSSSDREAASRATEAMMQMRKLDINALQAAFNGD